MPNTVEAFKLSKTEHCWTLLTILYTLFGQKYVNTWPAHLYVLVEYQIPGLFAPLLL